MRIVLKCGGELLSDARADELGALCQDVRQLISEGASVLIVHGGGPQTSDLMRRLGQAPRMVAGRRVTDEAALGAMIMAVRGAANTRLVSALRSADVDALGVSGLDGGLVEATRRPPRVVAGGGQAPIDFGQVGDVARVRVSLCEAWWAFGLVPAVACLAATKAGEPLNINADAVSVAMAIALKADALCMVMGGVPGICRDPADARSRMPRLRCTEAAALIDSGVIAGGMIPKVTEAQAALKAGVGHVHILGALQRGQLLAAIQDPGTFGTALSTD